MKEERNKRFDEEFGSKYFKTKYGKSVVQTFLTTEIHTILQEVKGRGESKSFEMIDMQGGLRKEVILVSEFRTILDDLIKENR